MHIPNIAIRDSANDTVESTIMIVTGTSDFVLSPTEFLMIGGWSQGARLNTVYMGTLTCSIS